MRLGVSFGQLAESLRVDAGAVPQGQRRSQRRTGAAPPKASRAASAATPPKPAKRAPPAAPAPPPAKLAADVLDELGAVLAEIRGRMAGLPAVSAEYRALAAQVPKIIMAAETIRLRRPSSETAEGRAAVTAGHAKSALAKIRAGCVAVAQREAETATCLRCGGHIGPELVAHRRAEVEASMAETGAA